MKPLILIVCDELIAFKNLNQEYLSELSGIQKFRKKMIDFPNHYTNSTPCSSARSVLYTGKHTNVTKITENIETTWQKTLKEENPFIETLGNYFKNVGYKTNYKGKFHISKDLVPTIPNTYKPLIATETYLNKYGFDEFEKFGDFCYDRRLALFNDELVIEQKLPLGNSIDKCDFYDFNSGYGYDGVLPFLKGPKSKDLFALVINFDNPHDIKNSNIQNNVSTIQNTTTQIIGFNSDTIPSSSDYNNNYKMFSNIPFNFEKSFLLNNGFNSLTNNDANYCAMITEISLKYLFYGTEYFNIEQAQQYQTAYYRILKQLDGNLNILYDYFEANGIFDNCVVCITSDHGDYVGSHGLYQKASPIYDEAYHVPLLISYPGMNKSNIIVPNNLITSHINLLPTLLTLCGIEQPLLKDLKPSFMDYNGNIINADYNVVKLSLSILFGPLLIQSLKNLDLPEINQLIKFKANNYNYLTIQSFSISSIINYQDNIFNCGFYFSLLDVFLETLKNYELIFYNNIFNDSNIYILTSENNDIAFIGLKSNILLFLQTNIWSSNNLSKLNIELYDQSFSNIYNNYLQYNNDYNIEIVSKNNNSEILIFSGKINSDDNLFYIDNPNGDKIIGSLKDLFYVIKNNLLPIDYNTTNIKTYFNFIDLENDIYIYPFYFTSKLYIKTNNFKNYKNFLLNNSDRFLKIMFNSLNRNDIINLNNINNLLIVIIINFINQVKDKLILPGYGLDVLTLKNNFFIEIFNISTDPNEIINLADSSRINEYTELNNNLLHILYNNIDVQELKTIFISLPSTYYFSSNFLKSEIVNNIS